MQEHRDKDGIVVLPGRMAIDDCLADVNSVTSLTPSGIEVFYSWAPRRHYKLRQESAPFGQSGFPDFYPWREVPSVTSVLNVLDKSGALSWWSQGIAAEGVIALIEREELQWVD